MPGDYQNILSELKNIRYWVQEQDRHIAELKKERDGIRAELHATQAELYAARRELVRVKQ